MDKIVLVGTWKLLRFEVKSVDGGIIYPYGKDAVGYIIYTMSDYMCVGIMSANRSKCSATTVLDATINEKLEIANSYSGYLGRYEITNDTINHYPEVSSFPNLIHVKQIRKYEYKDNKLILISPSYVFEGKEMYSSLLWERA